MMNIRLPIRCLGIPVFALTCLASPMGQVPSFKEVSGHHLGERITQHHVMVRYLEALARSSPRVVVVDQGRSWEGRELLLAIVTAPENHRRLDEIRRNAQLLGDPRELSESDAARLMESQPAVVWLGGSIHGFEFSGAEGLLKLVERLTTGDDEETLEVLRNGVILIDPILNPDGRDAHAQFNDQRLGRLVNSERDDWVNDNIGWEGLQFRTGHYYFDTNRDWFAHTQRESLARVKTIREWRPQAGVDAHEMGPDVEFYFDPPADPVSPFFPEYATKWLEVFGRAHAEAFDEAGFEYTTREMFNYFYPAYTTAYLSYQGAAGMLYEQGSSRGLALKRSDGTVRTLGDALEQQYVASWALVRTATRERRALLRDYYEAHRAAVDEGMTGIRRYLVSPEGDPYHVRELVNLLIRNGVEVHRLTQPVRLNDVRDRAGREIGQYTAPAGAFLIEASQPRNRLIRALMEPDVPVPDDFLREARERVERAENPRFYDITAYSLPLLFNLTAFSSPDGRAVVADRLTAEIESSASLPPGRARYAYLIDGRQSLSLSALYQIRDRGYRAGVLTESTRIDGATYGRGTVVVRVGLQDDGVHEVVREAANRFGLEVAAIHTGLPEAGFTPPGSPTTIDFRKPEIALVAEQPVSGYSFGWAWYTLDRHYELPHTILRARSLRNARLDRFDTIVLPALAGAAFRQEIGDEGLDRLKRWVRDGGTLVVIGGAVDFVREQMEMTGLRSWYDTEDGKKQQRFSVPGAVFITELNRHSWLTVGYGEELPVLVTSDRLLLPADEPPSPARRVAARYRETGSRVAGHAWDEAIERIGGTVFAYEERIGRGRVIAFSEDVNFRVISQTIPSM